MDTMTGLNALPNELLVIIISMVNPDDLVNLICSERRFYELATVRLRQHRSYMERYSCISLARNQLPKGSHEEHIQGINTMYPEQLLLDIWQDPYCASYIRYIEYACSVDELALDDEDVFYNTHTQAMIEQTSGYAQLMDQVSLFRSDEELKLACASKISHGHPEGCLLLILALARNLSVLMMQKDVEPEWWLNSPQLQDTDCFGKLTTIRIARDSMVSSRSIQPWFQLPRLQSFTISKILNEYYMSQGYESLPQRRELTRLCLRDGEADGDIVAKLLDDLTGLQSFGFDYTEMNNHDDGWDAGRDTKDWKWETSDFVQSLEDCASSTLEELNISFQNPPLDKLPTLRMFEKLGRFSGPLDLLQTTDSITANSSRTIYLDLATVFPATLKDLTLEIPQSWEQTTSENTIPQSESEILPTHALQCNVECDDFGFMIEDLPQYHLELQNLDSFPQLSSLKLSKDVLSKQSFQALTERGIQLSIGAN